MKKVKSKISFQHWDEKVIIKKDHSNITIGEFYQMCRLLALAAGYTESLVNEYFGQL